MSNTMLTRNRTMTDFSSQSKTLLIRIIVAFIFPISGSWLIKVNLVGKFFDVVFD